MGALISADAGSGPPAGRGRRGAGVPPLRRGGRGRPPECGGGRGGADLAVEAREPPFGHGPGVPQAAAQGRPGQKVGALGERGARGAGERQGVRLRGDFDRYRLPIPRGTELAALVPLAEQLFVEPEPSLDAEARREAEAIASALGKAMERPHTWDGLESYQVFFVRRFEDGPVPAAELLAGCPIPELVLGETSSVPSGAERQDVLDGTITPTWPTTSRWCTGTARSSPSPRAWRTSPTFWSSRPPSCSLESFATYDALLYRGCTVGFTTRSRFAGAPCATSRTPRYRALQQRRTAALLLELSEMTERLEMR